MARRKPARRRKPLWLYLIATAALLAAFGAGWYWWDMQSWAPEEGVYPDQGVLVSQRQGLVGFQTVAALGGKFAYLVASEGESGKDMRFSRNVAAATGAGLKVGALHAFDPCISADKQSANFVTMVPRNADMLPPAIALIDTADSCEPRVSDAAVESELMTFINQVETHSGQRAILRLSSGFEERYHVAERLDRDLWLIRERFSPTYGGRPWLLWSANSARSTDAAEQPLEWVVVQP